MRDENVEEKGGWKGDGEEGVNKVVNKGLNKGINKGINKVNKRDEDVEEEGVNQVKKSK